MRNCPIRVCIALTMLALAMMAFAGMKGEENQRVETRVVKKTIKPSVRYELSRSVGSGRVVKVHGGKAGSVTRTYRVNFKKGKPVSKVLLKEERTEPEPTLFLMGRQGFETSRGSFVRSRVMTMVATAYHSMVTGTGRTRTGRRATYGIAAVDPRVIPLNSLLFIEGYGLALACDTGGAIKGNRIDLCYDSRHVANSFGHKRVRVHVLR